MVCCVQLLLGCVVMCSIGIVESALFRNLSFGDVIINVNKGYALRRIGTFAGKLQEEVVHTFVSLSNVCTASPNSDVCVFATDSIKTEVLELTTELAQKSIFPTMPEFDKDSVSQLIRDDLSQALTLQTPEKHSTETQSITHPVRTPVALNINSEIFSSIPLSSNSTRQQQPNQIPRFSPTAAAAILNQFNNQKIGFDFMNNNQLKLFLTTVFRMIDPSYVVSNLHESLALFHKLIIGQSIFALRFCPLNEQQSSSRHPCLVVSTLFVRSPLNNPSSHIVYQMIPFPTVANKNKYMYSDMPIFIGVNQDQQTLIAWNKQSQANECSFSLVVLCSTIPPTVPFVNSRCLSELLNDEMNSNHACQVTRSIDTQSGVTKIDNGLWLFYDVQHIQFCQIYSLTDNIFETISISEESIIQIPCDKTITCFGNQLPSTPCVNRRLILLPTFFSYEQRQHGFLKISTKNTTNRLLSAFKAQRIQSYQDLMMDLTNHQSFVRRATQQIGYGILTLFCTFLLAIIIYILKCAKNKLQSGLDTLHEVVFDMLNE